MNLIIFFTEMQHFPKEHRLVLEKYGFKPEELPVLDLGDRIGSTGYIDFIEWNELTEPFMQFKDKSGRLGIVFIMRPKEEAIEEQIAEWNQKNFPLYKVEALLRIFKQPQVCVIFQRYVDDEKNWKFILQHPYSGSYVYVHKNIELIPEQHYGVDNIHSYALDLMLIEEHPYMTLN